MFYGQNLNGVSMVVIWIGVTLVFWASLHLALKATKIGLERNQELYVVVISALVALTPLVGPYLAFIPAFFLTYRMADAGVGKSLGAMVFAWLITFAILLTLGLIRVFVFPRLFK